MNRRAFFAAVAGATAIRPRVEQPPIELKVTLDTRALMSAICGDIDVPRDYVLSRMLQVEACSNGDSQ